MPAPPGHANLLQITLPPGLWRNGTSYQALGRWYDASLVRFFDQEIRPMGGWTAFSVTAVSGAARRMLAWLDQAGDLWTAVGTHSGLYVYDPGGNVTNITPTGFVAGRADANNASGYGGGSYGAGAYGASSASNTLNPATVWSLDTLEQYLVGCTVDDGKIYKWGLSTGAPAAVCAGAPVNNRAVVVTEEGFLFALGAGGDPRNVAWADQDSFTAWTPGSTSQADSYNLQTTGKIMCGLRLTGGTIIFTTTDVHLAVYQGPPDIFTFALIGSDCGIVSQAAFCSIPNMVVWMGNGGFWSYNGTLAPMSSDVGDYVFGRLNPSQVSKVFAVHNAAFGEVTWYYPSNAGTEVDSYVLWNYRENTWNVGSMARTCGIEAGVWPNPMMVDAAGKVWTHESGFAYPGAAATPYLTSGPIEISETYRGLEISGIHMGERVWDAVGMIPDARTLGDGTITLYSSFFPLGPEATWGPYNMADPTSFRVSGRQMRMKVSGVVGQDWRFGVPRIDFRMGGAR